VLSKPNLSGSYAFLPQNGPVDVGSAATVLPDAIVLGFDLEGAEFDVYGRDLSSLPARLNAADGAE